MLTMGAQAYVPYALVSQLGDPTHCDPDYYSPSLGRVLLEIIDAEGPVEGRRLARLAAKRFGLDKLHTKREVHMMKQLPPGLTRKTRLGTYVWAASVDPAKYTNFRVPINGTQTRKLEEISPEETLNAMRAVTRSAMSIEIEELCRVVAGGFGMRRVTASMQERLKAIVAVGLASGALLGDAGGYVRVPAT